MFVVSMTGGGGWLLVLLAAASFFLPPRARDPDAAATPAGSVAALRSPLGRPARIGLVFDVGGRGDKSFNDAAYEGLRAARRTLGAHIEYVEPSDGDDRASALRLFAARGFDRVIAVGYVFSRDLDAVARDYPSVRFAGVDYAPPESGEAPPNVVGLIFREEEGAYLVGAAAALHRPGAPVGFVGGMDIPLIRRFEAGYRAGVAAVCPDCRVVAAYAGSTPSAFKDPARGAALATAQYAHGVQVIFHAAGSTGLGVFGAAQRLGRFAIGVDADQHDEAPAVVITSLRKRVDVVVLEEARDAATRRFQRGVAGLRSFGLAEGGVDWVHAGPHARQLAPATVARVEALRAAVVSGQVRVPRALDATPGATP